MAKAVMIPQGNGLLKEAIIRLGREARSRGANRGLAHSSRGFVWARSISSKSRVDSNQLHDPNPTLGAEVRKAASSGTKSMAAEIWLCVSGLIPQIYFDYLRGGLTRTACSGTEPQPNGSAWARSAFQPDSFIAHRR